LNARLWVKPFSFIPSLDLHLFRIPNLSVSGQLDSCTFKDALFEQRAGQLHLDKTKGQKCDLPATVVLIISGFRNSIWHTMFLDFLHFCLLFSKLLWTVNSFLWKNAAKTIFRLLCHYYCFIYLFWIRSRND
jgi:hypothetical protein